LVNATPQIQDRFASRARRFWKKPLREKADSIKYRWRSLMSVIPVPLRLSFGAWWLLQHDNLGEPLRAGAFEKEELDFVGRFLRPGMTVLDLGAHQGLYTLLASKQVGPTGRVFSFEPSPRERRKLRAHLVLNFCVNVRVQPIALGVRQATADLFVVQGYETGCNSLKPPVVGSGTLPVSVRVDTLDHWIETVPLDHVDFIKLDVEGAELDVLQGATMLLHRRPRPLILAEVQDVRTAPWGYRASEILNYLRDRDFIWFRILPGGTLAELDLTVDSFDGNFVACPAESVTALGRSAPQ
jgi:FkbM family methyltransferase